VVALSDGRDALPAPPFAQGEPVYAPVSVAEIYDTYFDFVWCALRRLGVKPYQLEDAVQDVFVVVQRRLADFEGRSSLKTWLFGIALRVAKDHRRRHVKQGAEVGVEDDSLVGTDPDPRAAALQAEAAALIQTLLDGLDEDRRVVFVLTELEEFTAAEIAETLGIGINTVYSRLRLARRDVNHALLRHRAREIGKAHERP
jgi:RNA polymerase sigma-70 factor, ECF subfamily